MTATKGLLTQPKIQYCNSKGFKASPYYMMNYNIFKTEKDCKRAGRLKNGTAMSHQFIDEYSLQYAKWLTPCFL